MPEYVRDCDGDVWERDAGGVDAWRCLGVEAAQISRAEVERDFGPATPCDADGYELNQQPDDVRELLAAAFDHFARTALEMPCRVGANPRAARVTAAALRSGEITG